MSTFLTILRLMSSGCKRLLVVSVAANLFVSQFPALLAFTSKAIVDSLAIRGSAHAFLGWALGPVALGSIYLILLLLQYAGQVFLVFANETLTEAAAKNIHEKIIQASIRLEGLSYFDSPAFHDRRTVLENTALYIPMNFLRLLTDFFSITVTILGMAVLLLGLHPLVPVLMILSGIPDVLTQKKAHRLIYEGIKETAQDERLKDYYRSVLISEEYAKEVRIFDLRTRFIDKYKEVVRRIFAVVLPIRKQQIKKSALSRLLLSLVTVLPYLWAVGKAVRGNITVGELVMFMTAIVVIQLQMSRAAQTLAGHQDLLGAVKELVAWLGMKPDISSNKSPKSNPKGRHLPPHIQVSNLWFKYPGSKNFILKGLSLEIKSGESLAIVGRNGSGKTTFVKLLSRLYDPDQGIIQFDGDDIRSLDLHSLRESTAVIFQDFMRYYLSVKENISLTGSYEPAVLNAVREAGRAADVAQLIGKLPREYETPLGRQFDDGVELSGGEWQRLALARAFYRKAGLLILDEPTASLDIATEAAICARFKEMTEGKTTVLISHRLSTVRIADRIAVIENGKVVETGDHHSLMSLHGLYEEMFTAQAERYQLESETVTLKVSAP